nr:zinc finger, CCHC-type [Tanacetum cinerariifolium]
MNQIIDLLNVSSIKYALTVNPNIYVFIIKQFWSSVSVKTVHDVSRLQALVDRKKVIITEATIRDALRLGDAECIECLPNEEIFTELARMGYEKPSTKLTFYKAFFSSQWKFLIHTILQCMSAKRTSWNEFSSSMASAVIWLSTSRKFNFSKVVGSLLGYLIRKGKLCVKKVLIACFVGYVEHSKTYRFYVIEPNESVSINSIKESRDAIFDENCFSSTSRPKDIMPNLEESQTDDHSHEVPSEIPEPRKVDKTKKFLSSKFSMKDMGEANVILGIKIKRVNKGIVITRSRYIEKILKKFNHEDCSPVNTLMDPIEKLKLNTGKPVDQLEYSRAIGCLMYAITSTRPDSAYVVGRLSRFTSNPSRQHWKAITRMFKYLRDSSSTIGWVFLLGGGAISWAFKKQTCITGSTMESEFVALVVAGEEAEWLRNLIYEIPIWSKPKVPIYPM